MTGFLHPSARVCSCLLAIATSFLAQQAAASPVKIFVMAGQSNMLGKGTVSPVTTPGTLDYIVANDPEGKYQFLKSGGSYVVRDDVWIRDQDPVWGGLTVGFGGEAAGLIGPELGFGHVVGDALENPVLIVKCAWGGKSLGFDFCPPSSRVGAPSPVAAGDLGFYYSEILRLVNEATSNLAAYVPGYAGEGYEIAGFGWHQGWNDRIDGPFSAAYEVNMANFINDIRADLGVPDMPFVIATTGMDGKQGHGYTQVELAQLKMADTAAYPAFAGNVAVIDARATYEGLDFWQPVSLAPANEGYHWNRSGKTYLHLGLAMGDAMNLLAPGRAPYRLRASGATLTWKNGTEIPTSVRVLRNSVEIAAAAPADPPVFVDATAPLGDLEYELQFTMSGAPAAPLVISHSTGVTDLTASYRSNGMRLSWSNNLAYTGIEVRRNGSLIHTLPGNATSYTDPTPPAGANTYTVAPTDPGSTPAEVAVSVSAAPRGTATIYEPFDMPVGAQLPGQPGGIGIDNLWHGDTNVTVASGNLTFGALPVFGNRTTRSTGSGAGSLFLGDVLQEAGLISSGSELWFSFLVPNPNNTGISTAFVIGNEAPTGTTTISNSGSAIGVRLNQGTQVQPMIYQNGTALATGATQATLAASETALVVGHIQWAATPGANCTISVYTPASGTLALDTPQSVSAAIDFSNFRILSIWGNTTAPAIDEIRFGATYEDVIGAGADTSEDLTPPTPAVMSFAVPPAAISETEITMTAATATDDNGVQYRFHNVTRGTYSLWQGSPVFTDTGLTPGTGYIYTVQARDKSVNQNTNTASPETNASTLPPDLTPPPVPGFASPPTAISTTAITMTATTVADPEGTSVEYRFHNTTLGTDSGWQASTSFTANGLSPATNYVFTVQARDSAFYQNESAQSSPLDATTYAITFNNGTWDASSGGDWSDASKWQGNLVANGTGFTASFNMTGSGDRIVAVDTVRTIGNLSRSWAVNNILTIGGTSVLTMEVPSGIPTITNNDAAAARRMIITAPITGSQGLEFAGGGMIQLNNNTITYTGPTAVNGGSFLDFGGLPAANIGGGTGRNITVNAGSTLRFSTLSNALLNRIVETSDVIVLMTGSTGNALNFGSSTGANLPNAFLGNWASNGAKCEYTGTLTPASDAYRLGSTNSSGLLGIRSVLSGSQGLIVGGRVNLVAANTFTGDTTIPTGAKLVVGNNLALQHSALDVGSAGGTFALAAGTATGKITGETAASSPTFGGLKGSRNLSAAFTASSGGNNESNLASSAVTGFTLNVSTGKTCIYSGLIANFAANTTITKTGLGTQVLSGANTYTGATNVNQGTLALVGGSHKSPITVAAGASLGFTLGSPTTSTAWVDLSNGTVKITGTVDNVSNFQLMTATPFIGTPALDASIPDYALELQNGGTELWLVYTGVGGLTYFTWSSGAAADIDSNGDGVKNGIAWALGATDPNANAIDLLPTLDNTIDPDFFIFNFNRSDDANDDPNTAIEVEYGSDLSGWTTAVAGPDVVITETPGSPTDAVEVKIRRTLVVGGKLFARLNVVVTP